MTTAIGTPRYLPLARHGFDAMGTTVEVIVVPDGDEAPLLAAVEREFERLEALFSRFRPDSELSRLNREGAATVSPEVLEVVELALAAREATDGRFDPTVHDALVAAGYDRSFEDVGPVSEAAAAAPCGGGVHVDRRAGVVVLDPGVRLDLGGIAKGWAVDRACELFGRTRAGLVNAGGDLAVRGAYGDWPWPVAVEAPGEQLAIAVRAGAVATSGTDARRWRRGESEAHHLIDPRTGLPSETDLLRVTAMAPTAAEAEVWAKALLLAGEREAAAEAQARGISCIFVTNDDRVVRIGELA